jgi:hypothetical protein
MLDLEANLFPKLRLGFVVRMKDLDVTPNSQAYTVPESFSVCPRGEERRLWKHCLLPTIGFLSSHSHFFARVFPRILKVTEHEFYFNKIILTGG